MRRLTVLFAALSVLFIAPVDTASAANRTPGCITKYEFRKVTKGTALRRARRIIGATGKLTYSSSFSDGDVWRTFDFRQCGRRWSNSSVSLDFESTEREVWNAEWGWYDTVYTFPLRMQSKYAYWF